MASRQRQRRIRQLERCNPTVFGNVCLTPYQDLNHPQRSQTEQGVEFVNVSIASASQRKLSSALNHLKMKKWIKSEAILFNNINATNFHSEECKKCRCQIMIKQNSEHDLKDIHSEYHKCSDCKCSDINSNLNKTLIEAYDDSDNDKVACSSDSDCDYTNDAYYNLDFTQLERRRCSIMVDQLLFEIYSTYQTGITDSNSGTSSKETKYVWMDRHQLAFKAKEELKIVINVLQKEVVRAGNHLVRRLKRRDALSRQREARCEVITCLMKKIEENSKDSVPEFSPEMRFSLQPLPGDSGFSQWHSAMKMVSQLPEGIPSEFRRQLWLSLADKHLHAKGVDWTAAERDCFSEWSHPADAELGVQIVKDLHRTGCSLFCGKDGKENQALLKRVLLAYARWNKNVGYCQGFNMLAALILQVTDKSETDALKLMIYLIEGVLPDSYFADSLRGLSVDMAVFRELLRTKLPMLSKHLDTLQVASKEGTTSYEPPLTNVFTMQWFLTLFCNCLPQPTVLRVWDLILLEGNEILLRTSLAIWKVLADRIMTAKTADEFYCVMGMLMREILEFDLIDANRLVKIIVSIGPLTELSSLREHYLYNINPWGATPIANRSTPTNKSYHKDKLVLDIGVLKKQYTKLKQRQRQAHVIFNTAVARQTARPAPVAMNHLLLGKSALVSARRGGRAGPPKGAVPPPRHVSHKQQQPIKRKDLMEGSPKTLHWRDEDVLKRSSSSSSSSSDTELCDEPEEFNSDDERIDNSQLFDLPDDNLHSISMNAADALTQTTLLDLDHASPTADHINQTSDNSDIDVTLKSQITLCNDETFEFSDYSKPSVVSESKSASASPSGVIPDLLDFAEPPKSPSSCSFNMEGYLPSNVLKSNREELTIINSPVADIFVPKTGVDEYYLTLNATLQRSDSLPSEDGFDFERFLEERVKSLKEYKDSKEKIYSSEESLDTSDTSETERIKYARKNSVRALEIIQENSLILHRILQCQSRLTPTPPPFNLKDDIGICIESTDISIDMLQDIHLETSTTPTPTNENQNLSLTEDINLVNFQIEAPEKLNTFRPFEDFSEFLLKYQSKTPDTELIMPDLSASLESAMNTDQVPEVFHEFTTNFTNVDFEGDSIKENEGKIEIEQHVEDVEDDAGYLHRLISKYNFISKQPEDANSPEVKEKETDKYILDKSDNTCKIDVEPHITNQGDMEITEENQIDTDISRKKDEISNLNTPTAATIAEVDYNLEKYRQQLGSPLVEVQEVDTVDDLIEIDKNSKYNSILEYSRNLDEKFNNLILKSPKLLRLESERLCSKGLSFQISTQDEQTPKPSQSLQDFSEITNYESITTSNRPAFISLSPVSSKAKSFIVTTEVDQQEDVATSYASSKHTMDVDVLLESPTLKSPNRIYNPFPVSISSRQNKEVPFKLGLYKK